MNNNQPFISLTIAILSIMCGTLGLMLVCFGAVAIPASVLAEDQINFLGGSDAQTALTAGIAALILGLVFVGLPAFFLVNLITKRSKEKVIDRYEAFEPEIES